MTTLHIKFEDHSLGSTPKNPGIHEQTIEGYKPEENDILINWATRTVRKTGKLQRSLYEDEQF